MGRPSGLERAARQVTSQQQAPRNEQKGNIGYDNPRENIDPHVKTKAVTSKELNAINAYIRDQLGIGRSPSYALDVNTDVFARRYLAVGTYNSNYPGISGWLFCGQARDQIFLAYCDAPASAITGRIFGGGIVGKNYGNFMFYSSGAYGTGGGDLPRDTFLVRDSAGCWKLATDYSGAGSCSLKITQYLYADHIKELSYGHGVSYDNDLMFSSDNTNDIGASGATRPRTGYFGTSIVSPKVVNTATKTTVNGETSGTMVCAMPEQGSGYKKVILYCNALVGNATYTFPTSFQYLPQILGDLSYLSMSGDVTYLTVTGDGSSGYIILEGF